VVAPAVVVSLFDAVVLVVVVVLRHSAELLVVLGDAVALIVVRDDGVALVIVLGGDAVVGLTVIGCHSFVLVSFLDDLAVVFVVVLGGDVVVLGRGVSQAQKWRLCPLFVRDRAGLVYFEPRYDSVPPVWLRLEGQDRTRPGLVRASRAAVSSHAALGQPVQAPHYAMHRLVLRVRKDVPVVRHRWSHQQDTGSERHALPMRCRRQNLAQGFRASVVRRGLCLWSHPRRPDGGLLHRCYGTLQEEAERLHWLAGAAREQVGSTAKSGLNHPASLTRMEEMAVKAATLDPSNRAHFEESSRLLQDPAVSVVDTASGACGVLAAPPQLNGAPAAAAFGAFVGASSCRAWRPPCEQRVPRRPLTSPLPQKMAGGLRRR